MYLPKSACSSPTCPLTNSTSSTCPPPICPPTNPHVPVHHLSVAQLTPYLPDSISICSYTNQKSAFLSPTCPLTYPTSVCPSPTCCPTNPIPAPVHLQPVHQLTPHLPVHHLPVAQLTHTCLFISYLTTN